MIATLGLERMREPYVKHLQGALWELRLIGRDGIACAIYVAVAIMWLTPDRRIERVLAHGEP